MLIAKLKYILAFVYIHLSRNITKIKSNKQKLFWPENKHWRQWV